MSKSKKSEFSVLKNIRQENLLQVCCPNCNEKEANKFKLYEDEKQHLAFRCEKCGGWFFTTLKPVK